MLRKLRGQLCIQGKRSRLFCAEISRRKAIYATFKRLGAFATVLTGCLLLMTFHAQAATYYVCGTISSCNANGGTGWSGSPSDSNSGTSKSSPKKTLHGAAEAMSGGDTVIVGNGTYTGDDNSPGYNRYGYEWFPSGSANAYTTIKAEVDGQVILNASTMSERGLAVYGNNPYDYPDADVSKQSQQYILFRGFLVAGGMIYISAANHIKIINCGAYDAPNGNNWTIEGIAGTYYLFEGCFAYGGGRAKIGLYHAHYCIVRNCVARSDYADAGNSGPTSIFDNYSSYENEWQNNIAIDSDTNKYINTNEDAGAFAGACTSSSTLDGHPYYYRQCIALNNYFVPATVDNNNRIMYSHWDDCVFWKCKTGLWAGQTDYLKGFGSFVINHLTAGLAALAQIGEGVWFNGYSSAPPKTISNSIFYSFPTNPLFYNMTVNYPNYYSVASVDYGNTSITNAITTNPLASGLKYLPRIETDQSLYKAGSGGTYVGANIVYQIGKSGTLYGETGYNLLQNGTNGQETVKMWPFPNESMIQTWMAAYNNHGVTGARGFCTGQSKDGSSQTLTKYIWEYLGNQIPSNIYGTVSMIAPKNLCVMGKDGKCVN